MEDSSGFSIKKSLEVRSKCCSHTHGAYKTAAKGMPKLISLNFLQISDTYVNSFEKASGKWVKKCLIMRNEIPLFGGSLPSKGDGDQEKGIECA